MSELSGLAVSRKTPGILWTHNGNEIDRLFAITREGRPAGNFTLPRSVSDAEDLAIGPGPVLGEQFLFLGDIGDPSGQRRTVVIVRAPEPLVDPEDSDTHPLDGAVYFNLEYPDSGHDAEALLIDPVAGDLYLVSKEPGQAVVFRATQEQLFENSTARLERVAVLPVGLINGGDISPDGQSIALRSEDKAWLWTRAPGQSIAAALASSPAEIPLASEEQGEALAFDQNSAGYLTVSEGEDQPIYFIGVNRSRFTIGEASAMVASPELVEVSGIAASRRLPGVVWLHNDGTNQNIFAVSTNGEILGAFTLQQSVTDLEDAAVGPGNVPGTFHLYLADIGDNGSDRDRVQVIRVPEPDLESGNSPERRRFAEEVVYQLEYPDGAHDAEALMVDPILGDLYLATKEADGFRLYAAPRASLVPNGIVRLVLVHSGDFALVSGGAISPDGQSIALRREDAAWLWRRAPGQSIAEALNGIGEEIPVIGPPREPNGEGISFTSDSQGYLTSSEGEEQPLYFFRELDLPRLLGEPIRTGHGWQVLVTGCAGQTVLLQASSDLREWRSVAQVTLTGDATPVVHEESHEHFFYRIAIP